LRERVEEEENEIGRMEEKGRQRRNVRKQDVRLRMSVGSL